MSQNPLISVIIPIYNVEKYLKECLDSVTQQSLHDIEIICINDGSSDACGEILESYAQSDKRIIAIHKANEGVGKARNKALRIAKGEFVCFIDPDDFYPTLQTLEALYHAARQNQALICGGCFSDYQNGVINTDFDEMLFGYTFKQNGFIEYRDYQFDFGFTRFIYQRTFLLDNNIFHPHYTRYEDPVFFVKAMIAAKRFYAIAEITYCYRIGHQKNLLAWSETQWSDQNKGLLDVLCLAKSYQLENLYNLTLARGYSIATELTDAICAGGGSIFSLCKLNRILSAKGKEIYTLSKTNDNALSLHFEHIHTSLKYLNTLLHSPLQLFVLILKFYAKKSKSYFRVRLFREHSLIKLFGITFYESYTMKDSRGGGGHNVVFYAFILKYLRVIERFSHSLYVRVA
ncbi:glycosyltransferase family 2 protein [Helicobacter sp. MIT 05-5293]|uniref:glycosyltransferase family 2 protein n=1 Tax=Helicobacter sp. MIT 05-5293 TaxID=1548149 RepID=UPI0010FEE297|nr:glycosyltransferase family 2 protein [Helicobacter sp. MIT 05-5293]TLD80476.1 glycosyltransferase family 2 protein [Helicobacter sp. MIT 05-5293]